MNLSNLKIILNYRLNYIYVFSRYSVTKAGYVIEIDGRDPNRVKTHNCRHHFRKVNRNLHTSFDVYDFK